MVTDETSATEVTETTAAEEKATAEVTEMTAAEEKATAEVTETIAAEEKATKRRPAAAKKEAKAMTIEEMVDAIKGMTTLELSELVKTLEATFGISAAAPVAVAAAPGAALEAAAAPEEEQTEFNVILKDVGANKISVIKAVREVTALGLKEAKDLVESAPKPVKEGIAKAEAAALKEKLETAGATVEIK